MKRIDYPSGLAQQIALFQDALGGVEYCIVELEPGETPNYQAINKLAMEDVRRQTFGEVDPTISIDPGKATSQAISVEQFFGPFYDLPTKRLIVNSSIQKYWFDYFYYDQPANDHTKLDRQRFESQDPLYKNYASKGYAAVFSNPPYGLVVRSGAKPRRMSNLEIGTLFNNLNQELFGASYKGLDIQQWSTDWCPAFFDSGHEWWGAYWWTIYRKSDNQVIVIAASTTD